MAKVALNKSSLTKQKTALKGYEQFLPSLELKQQQLKGIEAKAKRELKDIEQKLSRHMNMIEDKLPMIANENIYLNGMVAVETKEEGMENLLGLKLPTLGEITFDVREYSRYNSLHWLDTYVKFMKEYITLKERYDMQIKRLETIAKAVLKITQRVNLFEKVLIPTAQTNIKKIRIALSDDERAAVVRSKIAKAMHEKQHEEEASK